MEILTELELTTLKTLSTKRGVKGQSLLKDVIWLNTTDSKYLAGQTVKFKHDNDTLLFGKVENVMFDTTARKISYGISIEIKFEDTAGNLIEKQFKRLVVSELDILFATSDNVTKQNIVVMEAN